MKRFCALACLFVFQGTAVAQDEGVDEDEGEVIEETTYEETTETYVQGEFDLLHLLWKHDDARTLNQGQLDLRLGFNWETESLPANRSDENDDVWITPEIAYGVTDNLELTMSLPVVLGEGGQAQAGLDGNADMFVGGIWRIVDQQDYFPAIAFGSTLRLPTGTHSNGVDAEFRLIMTNEYDSGIRSHINAFVETVNSDNERNLRHFGWGVILGADGPLCADGSVRWVADYMHRSGFRYGSSNINLLELGWQWQMAEAHALGMSMQIGLDDNEDTPNFGVGLAYSVSIVN